MPKKRFTDIKRGPVLNTAHTRYIQKLSNPSPPDPGSRGARPIRQNVGVTPYGFSKVSDPKVLVTRPKDQALQIAGLFTAATQANVTANPANAIRVQGFLPAQVTIQQGARSTTVTTSEFTGLRYLKYTGLQKFVSPFGRNADTDLEFEARDLIRAKYLENNEAVIKRISFRAESRVER